MGKSFDLDKDRSYSSRVLGLFGAVLHHGLANLAQKAVPARAESVVATAKTFEDYLNDVPTTEARRTR